MRLAALYRISYNIAVAILLYECSLAAQTTPSAIGGVVFDSSHAILGNVQVVLENQENGALRKTVTNEEGRFLFPALSPGMFRLVASRAGFKSTAISDLELRIDQRREMEIQMEPGVITETVNVSTSVTPLQTETATAGQVIEGRAIVDLPVSRRNYLQLVALSAGVVPATDTTGDATRIGRPETVVHVAGSRASFTSYLIDGQESRGSRFGESTLLPSLDSIQELKVQRNFYSAEYGNSPVIITVSTKSGVKQFHGSLFEFLRNSALDATPYFNPGSRPPLRMNQFGGTLGGPLITDRTFFFVGYEGRRQRETQRRFATVPDPQLLAGDFSGRAPIADFRNNNAPFPDNLIPQARMNRVAAGFSRYIPLPNASTPQGNYVGAPSAINDFDQFHVRVDHRFSDKNTIFGRISNSEWRQISPGLLPFSGWSYPLNGLNAAVQYTSIFSSSFVNTLQLGFTRSFLASNLESTGDNVPAQLGFQNLVVAPIDYGLPRIQITGYSQMGHSVNTFRNWTNTYRLGNTMNLVRGRHFTAFGGEAAVNRDPQTTTNATNGRITFTGRFTSDALADYLLGAHTTASVQASGVVSDYRSTRYGLFFQDNYKATDRLSLNLGLRWEYHQPVREKGGAEGVFDASIPGLRLANDPSIYGVSISSPYLVVGGLREGVVKPQFTNFAPRIGAAFKLTSRTVVRAGAGIFFAIPQQNDLLALAANPGASLTQNYTNSPGVQPRLVDTLFDRLSSTGLPPTAVLGSVDPNRKMGYLEQVSFHIQQQLSERWVMELGYLGSAGHQLIGRQDLNQAALNSPGGNLPVSTRRPFPMFASVWHFFGGENANFHAMTGTVERRFASDFGFLATYTISKSLDTYSSAFTDYNSPHHVSSNRRMEYGRSAFDARNRFTAAASYDLPVGEGRRYLNSTSGWLRTAIAGWRLNAMIQFQSGLPFSVLLLSDRSNTGTIATQRPNRVGDGALPVNQRSPERWFEMSAFALNPIDSWGTSGRNILDQDGVRSIDVSLLKDSRITERLLLQFRAECFNLWNSSNFGPPGTYLDGANFGVVTSAGQPRHMQIALKLSF